MTKTGACLRQSRCDSEETECNRGVAGDGISGPIRGRDASRLLQRPAPTPTTMLKTAGIPEEDAASPELERDYENFHVKSRGRAHDAQGG